MKKFFLACGLSAALAGCVTPEETSYRVGNSAPIKSSPVLTAAQPAVVPDTAKAQPRKANPAPVQAAPATGGRGKVDTAVRAGTNSSTSRAPVQIKLYD